MRTKGQTTCSYSRSPKNPALQQLQKSAKSASTTPQRAIWNYFATVGVRDFWANGCTPRKCAHEQPLPPETGPLQLRKCPPSQSEEKDEPNAGNMHLAAPMAVSTRKQQRPPAPLPTSTSAHLHFPAVVMFAAGNADQVTLPPCLVATNSTLGAPLPVLDAETPIVEALRVGGGSWHGTSHGLVGGDQERQTQQRGDQQGDT